MYIYTYPIKPTCDNLVKGTVHLQKILLVAHLACLVHKRGRKPSINQHQHCLSHNIIYKHTPSGQQEGDDTGVNRNLRDAIKIRAC